MDGKPSVWLVLASGIMGALLVAFLFTPPLLAGHSSGGGDKGRLVFAWTSLAMPGTPTTGDLRVMWGAACRDLGGPKARLILSPMRVTFQGIAGREIPAIQGICEVLGNAGIPDGDSSA